MFCPHCGIESTSELNYCKRCGGNLSHSALASAPETRPAISTGAAFIVGGSTLLLVVMGLTILFLAMSEMRGGGVPPDLLKMTLFLGALTILGSVVSLTCLWAYLLGPARRAPRAPQLKAPAATNEFGPARLSALPERPAPSVVEHTTRTLEQARK